MSNRLTRFKTPLLFACSLVVAGMMMADSIAIQSPKGPEDAVEDRKLPLWQAAIRRTRREGNYVAACVRTEMSVFDGDEKLLGMVNEVERMEREGGKTHWKTASKNQTGDPGMTIRADFGLQADPASALEGYDEWHLREKGVWEGKAFEKWEGISKANPNNTVIVSIDVESEFPRKADFTIPFFTPLGSQLVNMTLTYARSPEGVWLPDRSVCDQRGRFLLIRRHIRLAKTYTEWEAARR
jgi:hypothetical protein